MGAPNDATLAASEDETLVPASGTREWCLTLAFHPDTRRIGEQARVTAAAEPVAVGREAPLLSSPFPRQDAVATGLSHRRVSRNALTLSPVEGGWRLARDPQSSRLRLDGVDVETHTDLSPERARAGFILLLGQSVLLHVRLAPALESSAREARHVPGLSGISAAMRRLCRDLRHVAASGEDVLLLGPTGTGKDVVAQAIHDLGERSDEPLITVNMGALPPQLAAAELFGSRRGAFTGAHGSREGYFQQAAGGTLFLDEIGDTPAEVQPLLLRAVQSRELQVVGGGVERVEVQIIAATEVDPDAPGSAFRSALRHRLAAQELRLAPLVQRLEDVGPIAAIALRRSHSRALSYWHDGEIPEPEAQRWAQCFELLHGYHWPGNVRELLQALAQIGAVSGRRLELPSSLLERLSQAPDTPGTAENDDAASDDAAGEVVSAPTARPLKDLTDAEFIASWEAANYEVAAMARRHDCSRQAVYRRLKSLRRCRLANEVPLGELLAVLDECRGDLAATARRLEISHVGLQARLRASGVTAGAASIHDAAESPSEPRTR